MASSFLTFRKFTYGVLWVFAGITLAVAATVIRSMVGSIDHLAGLAVAIPALTLIALPTFLAVSRHDQGIEIASLALLWVFWLSIGADATTVRSQLSFSAVCGFIGGEVFNVVPDTYCTIGGEVINELVDSYFCKLGVILAFGFMSWIILTGYLLVLICYLRGRSKQTSLGSYSSSRSLSSSLSIGGWGKYRGDPKSACLMCRSRPKNGGYDFCGITCRDAARKLAPLLLEVPRGHTTFTMVENKFKEAWKPANRTLCPPVRNVYRVVETSSSRDAYSSYAKLHGNECFRYHGTRRSCQLGENGNAKLCTSSFCNACSIIKTSFKVSLANPGGAFGKGVYTSSASNKSSNYSDSNKKGVMFLTKVALGKVHNVNRFAEVKACPSGKQSVIFNRMNGELNETVVYTNDAIRPVFLIVFG